MRSYRLVGSIAFGLLALTPAHLPAQNLADRLRRRAEEAAKKKLAESAAPKDTTRTASAAPPAPNATPAASAPAPAPTAETREAKVEGPSPAPTFGSGAFVNFDFVPGNRTLFTDDFTKDDVGNFPRRLEFKSGNFEVADLPQGRYLRATTGGRFFIPLPEVLPERFTVELDYKGWYKEDVQLFFADEAPTRNHVAVGAWGKGGVVGGAVQSVAEGEKDGAGQLMKVRIMVDGAYAKVYMNGTRVANVPNANLGRSNKILVRVGGTASDPSFIGNVRVAAGGKKIYDALAETGRVATQGIFFDTGSDRIRPESAPTLTEIASMLKEHSELSIAIEGHTDNVGAAEANRALSERRAAAVRQALIATHGVDGQRLASAGFGASKPASGNDTPEGRQMNRRVELVKR